MDSGDLNGSVPFGAGCFETTHWSVVLTAKDGGSPDGAAALERLCRAYWHPLYSHVRRRGYSPADAQDMTQEFFSRLIQEGAFVSVEPSGGRFRSYLLASLNHLLANEWDKRRTLKRGGAHDIVSLDGEEAERRFACHAAINDSPEKIFDRQWALTVLDRALARLREEFMAAGKLAQFDRLKVFLSDVAGDGDYAALAGPLGLEAGGVAVAVHRLRLRYREIVRAEIAQTVSTESELKAEMRHLFATLD
jgi:RNA polymerase sigma-70 factor (ECF subfamily)